MTNLRHTVLSIAIATDCLGAFAQTDAEHAQHHPAEPAKKATKAVIPKAPTKSTESMAAMDSQMKTMREMHEKMMAAKTPEERKALIGALLLGKGLKYSLIGALTARATGEPQGTVEPNQNRHQHQPFITSMEKSTCVNSLPCY